MAIDVTDKDFKEKVIEKSETIPVIADFWADWCQSCMTLGPILENIEAEYKEKIILAKVNVDQAPETSKKYSIMSIPSIKMFKDGKIVDEFIGVMPEPNIKEWLDKNLKK